LLGNMSHKRVVNTESIIERKTIEDSSDTLLQLF
jgi:hypothetical protein